MSDSREQSYYEIALTNRQVMTIFVVLLVCVLAAFLGGVWVGRGDSAVVTTTEPAAIAAGVQPGEPPLEELDFFSQPAASDQVEGEASAGEDVGAASEEVASGPAQPVIIEEIGPRLEPAQEAAEAGRRARRPPAAREAPPKVAATPVPSSSAGESISGSLLVQVFSSTDQEQARRVLERVRGGGYEAVILQGDVDGRPMYRVRVGPYSDREEAEKVADRIRRAYKLDTWIVR